MRCCRSMQKSVEHLQEVLGNMHTGRASPGSESIFSQCSSQRLNNWPCIARHLVIMNTVLWIVFHGTPPKPRTPKFHGVKEKFSRWAKKWGITYYIIHDFPFYPSRVKSDPGKYQFTVPAGSRARNFPMVRWLLLISPTPNGEGHFAVGKIHGHGPVGAN